MRALMKSLAAVLGLMALLVFPATAAYAVEPVEFPPGEYLIDDSGVLSNSEAEQVQSAIEELQNEQNYNLHIAFVPEFTGADSAEAWAEETAELNSLGTVDGVLAVATEERSAWLSFDSESDISQEEEETILQDVVLPELRDDNWTAAAESAVAGAADAASGGDGNPNDGGGFSTVLTVLLVIALIGVGAFLFLRSRKNVKSKDNQAELEAAEDTGPVDPLAGVSVADLRLRAGSLLVACDDAIRTSEQEVLFAQAQYGDDAVKPFIDDITKAKAQLGESFKLQQQLDDHIPDTEEQQRTWLGQIIRSCEAANQTLGEHKSDFDELRKLEKRAPEALQAARRGAAQAAAKVDAAEQSLVKMQGRYSGEAIIQVADNIAQAYERLEFVETAAETAEEKIAAGDTASAVIAVRAAEESVQQTNVLLDAVDKLSNDLSEADKAIEPAVADIAEDVAAARAMVDSGGHPELSGPLARAESALSTVQDELRSGKIAPLACMRRIEEANHHLDEALAGVRDKQDQDRRSRSALQQAVMSARAQISGTSDYIAARRGGVGSEARTRLAEAQRNLDYALSIAKNDPTEALNYAHQANVLAGQAAKIAQTDVEGFGGMGGYGGGMYAGRRGGSGMGGAMLGGLLLGSVLGGGGFGGFGDGGDFGGGGFGGGDFGGGFDGGAGGSF
ncbi:TPM domain-containing protein [Arthrobacter monumenti]